MFTIGFKKEDLPSDSSGMQPWCFMKGMLIILLPSVWFEWAVLL